MGSGKNGELTGIDILNIIGLYVSLKNLDLNIDQTDIANQTQDINEQANQLVNAAIAEIHAHLEMQDKKIDMILQKLGEKNDENKKNG